MASTLIKLILSVVLLMLGFGVVELTVVFVVSSVAGLAIIGHLVNRLLPLNRAIRSAKRNSREILSFSLPLYLQRLLNQYGRNLETIMLGYFGVLAHVGVFSALLIVSGIGKMALDSLRKILAPIISELHSENKLEELRRVYQTTTKWAFTFNLPIFLTILLFGEALLSIFGQEFTAGATALIVLAVGTLFNVSTGICGAVINMSGHSKLGLMNSVIYLLTTILLDLILIPRWLLLGAAVAGTLTIVINNTLRLLEVYSLIDGLLPFNWSFMKPIIAALTAGGLTYSLANFVFVDQVILQAVVLVPVMWGIYIVAILTQKLSAEDRMILNKVRGRLKSRAGKFQHDNQDNL